MTNKTMKYIYFFLFFNKYTIANLTHIANIIYIKFTFKITSIINLEQIRLMYVKTLKILRV